ncbi:MAG: cyclic nucleotide-binding domain-containing protein [Acidobacteriota bacterium]|nr:MAG: cyclic nucleotide-binding domain-containing protein [Acidobacteriota bacterium]
MALWKRDRDPHELLAKGRYKEAVEGFKKLLKRDSDNVGLRIKLGDALVAIGSKDDGIRCYEKAAGLYAERGFLLKAVALQKKILKLDPTREESLKQIAQMAQAPPPPKLAALEATRPSAPRPKVKAEVPPKAAALEATRPSIPQAEVQAAEIPTQEIAREEMEAAAAKVSESEGPPPPVAEPREEAIALGAAAKQSYIKARVPLFSDLPPEEFGAFVKGLKHHAESAGAVIVREGAVGNSMFVISEGSVQVRTRDQHGEDVVLTDLDEGDFFGEVSLLKGVRRTATIVALKDVELLEMTKKDLDRISKKYPFIMKTVENFYAERVQHTVETLQQKAKL